MSGETPQPDRSAIGSGIDWVAKHWPRVRLAHEGVMVDRIQRVQRIGEVVARNAMTGKTADTDGWPDYQGTDKMGVEIGDRINNHYYPPQPAAKKPMGALAKAAIATALIGSGAGGVAAVPWLIGLFEQAQQPPAVEQPNYEAGLEISVK